MVAPRSRFAIAAVLGLVIVVGIGGAVVAIARSSDAGVAVSPAPIGHRKYLVFMADGVVPSIADVLVPGDAFQRDVMKRSPAEFAAYRQEANAFFRDRFGLDFSKSDVNNNVTLFNFMTPPALSYRAYTISGEAVPSTGWAVRDGGFNATVGPGGTTLRGSWGGPQGRFVPEGMGVAVGEYSIDVERPDGSRGKPINLRYQTVEPLGPFLSNMPNLNCDLSSDEYGNGLALGVYDVRVRADGTVHFTARNVLTFT